MAEIKQLIFGGEVRKNWFNNLPLTEVKRLERIVLTDVLERYPDFIQSNNLEKFYDSNKDNGDSITVEGDTHKITSGLGRRNSEGKIYPRWTAIKTFVYGLQELKDKKLTDHAAQLFMESVDMQHGYFPGRYPLMINYLALCEPSYTEIIPEKEINKDRLAYFDNQRKLVALIAMVNQISSKYVEYNFEGFFYDADGKGLASSSLISRPKFME